MNTPLKKFVSIIVLISFTAITLFSILSPFIASAAPTQSDINAVQQKKNEQQQKINQAEKKQQNAMDEKSEIEKKIDAAQTEIDTIQKDIDDASERIAQKEEELALAEEKAENQYETMKMRLRTMYEDNSSSYISLIFSGETLSDVFSYIELIKQLLNYDNNMYDNLLDTKNTIENAKIDIELEKEKYEENQNSVISKRNELKQLEANLESTISKLESDIEAYKKAYAAFEREEAALKAEIAATLKTSSSGGANYSGGKLAWPTPGYTYITSPYGYRLHPTLKVYKLHTGMDTGAPMNATVVAAEAGQVVTAKYNNAYGNYIVINHGGGLSTLYAHNTTLLVSAGQQVSRGQAIAKVGSTGFSTGPHCHFEVLVNGVCTDPMAYLK